MSFRMVAPVLPLCTRVVWHVFKFYVDFDVTFPVLTGRLYCCGSYGASFLADPRILYTSGSGSITPLYHWVRNKCSHREQYQSIAELEGITVPLTCSFWQMSSSASTWFRCIATTLYYPSGWYLP